MVTIDHEEAAGLPPETAPQTAPASDFLHPRRLVQLTLAVLLGLLALVGAAGFWFREPLLVASRWFVDSYGGLGVALGYFVPDATNLPLPNDVVAVIGVAGGMSFLAVVVFGTAGSILGGIAGYWIGRALRNTRVVEAFFEGRGRAVQATLQRHGVAAVGVAALTPLPYSIFCWAAGAARLPFGSFLLVSPLRLARVAGYLWLIQIGLLSTMR